MAEVLKQTFWIVALGVSVYGKFLLGRENAYRCMNCLDDLLAEKVIQLEFEIIACVPPKNILNSRAVDDTILTWDDPVQTTVVQVGRMQHLFSTLLCTTGSYLQNLILFLY